MIIPVLAALMSAFGLGTLAWYYNLNDQQKRQADLLANQYAAELYGMALDQLEAQQAKHVHSLVQSHFN